MFGQKYLWFGSVQKVMVPPGEDVQKAYLLKGLLTLPFTVVRLDSERQRGNPFERAHSREFPGFHNLCCIPSFPVTARKGKALPFLGASDLDHLGKL